MLYLKLIVEWTEDFDFQIKKPQLIAKRIIDTSIEPIIRNCHFVLKQH